MIAVTNIDPSVCITICHLSFYISAVFSLIAVILDFVVPGNLVIVDLSEVSRVGVLPFCASNFV
jgi:hypothetical protein